MKPFPDHLNEDVEQIYTRKLEGSGFSEYKAVMKIEAGLSSLVALVGEIDACP